MIKMKKVDATELARYCAEVARNKLAENVVEIKLDAENSIADYFVIGTATSEPHLRSLGSAIERQVREKYQLRPFTESGDSASGWMLIDFVNVVVHIMTPDIRDHYNLESLWGDSPDDDALKVLEEKTQRFDGR